MLRGDPPATSGPAPRGPPQRPGPEGAPAAQGRGHRRPRCPAGPSARALLPRQAPLRLLPPRPGDARRDRGAAARSRRVGAPRPASGRQRQAALSSPAAGALQHLLSARSSSLGSSTTYGSSSSRRQLMAARPAAAAGPRRATSGPTTTSGRTAGFRRPGPPPPFPHRSATVGGMGPGPELGPAAAGEPGEAAQPGPANPQPPRSPRRCQCRYPAGLFLLSVGSLPFIRWSCGVLGSRFQRFS